MTEQTVKSSDNVLQVGGNIEITNKYGLTVHEVRELTQIFMRENFPVLRDEAIAAAQLHVERFLKKFEDRLAQRIAEIDLNKFKDPDIQSSLNDAVIETAKKGDRGNTELLAELVIQRLNTGTTDFVSQVVSEAIKVVPRLSKEQIGLLTLLLFITSTKLNNAKSLRDLCPLADVVLDVSRASFGISEGKKSHLEYAGCVRILQIMTNSAYAFWKGTYEFIKNVPDEELKKTIEHDFPVLHGIATAYEENRLGQVSLTAVGTVIGLANLSQRVPGLSYENWIS